jgi:multiple sugar transport system substrate-binding protein
MALLLGHSANAATITVAAHYNAREIAPLLACFRHYERAQPGTRVAYQQIGFQDFFQTVMIARAGRAPVDVYNLYSIWAPQLIGTGALDAPPLAVQQFVRAGYTPATVAAATLRGRLWGIPSAVSAYQLVYNKRLLAAAGFRAPPRTWAELVRIGLATRRLNRQGNVLVGGFAFGPSAANVTHVFYAQMYAAGVPPYTADLRHTNLRSRVAVRILTEQAQLFRDKITSNSVSVIDFGGQVAAMAVMPNWQKYTLEAALGPRFASTIGVAPISTDGPGGTMIYSFFWGVDRASPVKRQAWDVLLWLNRARGRDGLSCTGRMVAGVGELTGNRADLAAMRPRADAFTRQYLAALASPGAVNQANLWHAEEVDRQLKYYIELAWAGKMTPAAALAAADTEIRKILAEQP